MMVFQAAFNIKNIDEYGGIRWMVFPVETPDYEIENFFPPERYRGAGQPYSQSIRITRSKTRALALQGFGLDI